jgi:hypothetical protein
MVEALEKLAGQSATGFIDWTPDAAIANIVGNWPSVIDAARDKALGLLPDPDFEGIVTEFMRENPRPQAA